MAHNGHKKFKAGRNEKKCAVYRMLRKKERSHIERIERHMERYKDDSPMAKNALEKYRQLLMIKK